MVSSFIRRQCNAVHQDRVIINDEFEDFSFVKILTSKSIVSVNITRTTHSTLQISHWPIKTIASNENLCDKLINKTPYNLKQFSLFLPPNRTNLCIYLLRYYVFVWHSDWSIKKRLTGLTTQMYSNGDSKSFKPKFFGLFVHMWAALGHRRNEFCFTHSMWRCWIYENSGME